MLRPSYSELMDILNDDIDIDSKITSRYTIVIAAAKRARQIIDGAQCYSDGATTDKAVSVAINEMSNRLIKILPEGLPSDTGDDNEIRYGNNGNQATEKLTATVSENVSIEKFSDRLLDGGNYKENDTEGTSNEFDDTGFDDDEFDEGFDDNFDDDVDGSIDD